MGSLRSAIDELVGEDLALVDTDSLKGVVVEIRGLAEILEAEWLRRLGALDHRQAHLEEGYASFTSWVRERCRLGAGAARALVSLARSLRDFPRTASAFLEGTVTSAGVRLLMRASSAHPEVYQRDEQVLVEAAAELSVGDLAKLISYWRGPLDDWSETEELHDRRRLHASRTLGGMVRVDGDLDPEGGEILLCALEGLSETTDPADHRTPAERRADALVEICRDVLDRGDLAAPSRRPHLLVTVPLETLEKRAGRPALTEGGGTLSPETLRRLACDAGVSRVITTGASQPLDVGRKTRVISRAQWLAVVARDGRCRWRGCDRPPRWCDVHHLLHWMDGGKTNLTNLVLLCRRHHRIVHEGGMDLDPVGPDPPTWWDRWLEAPRRLPFVHSSRTH